MSDLMQQAYELANACEQRAQWGRGSTWNPPRDSVGTSRLLDEAASLIRGLAALRAAPEGFVLVPVEPTVEALTAMSVAIGMEPLTPPNDEGSYPITGSQSTIRRCYDALVLAARPQEVE